MKGEMNNIRSRLRSAPIAAAFVALSAQATLAQQTPPATIVRTVLAVTTLPSVIDAPFFFKLTGPEKTVLSARGDFDKLIGSLRVK